MIAVVGELFQLTHPTRGATCLIWLLRAGKQISTHTPHTGCDLPNFFDTDVFKISTHTPHTGCDRKRRWIHRKTFHFNSHTPHGVRLHSSFLSDMTVGISTHTPHTGCDSRIIVPTLFKRNFNSHTPHGVRPASPGNVRQMQNHFNSHTPHGVRLRLLLLYTSLLKISTHTPHTGCDPDDPRPPKNCIPISTHTPHTGCDARANQRRTWQGKFQLTHPTRGATISSFC